MTKTLLNYNVYTMFLFLHIQTRSSAIAGRPCDASCCWVFWL